VLVRLKIGPILRACSISICKLTRLYARRESKLVLLLIGTPPSASWRPRRCSGVRQSPIWFALITRSLAHGESQAATVLRAFAFLVVATMPIMAGHFRWMAREGKVKSLEVKAHPSRIVESARYLLRGSHSPLFFSLSLSLSLSLLFPCITSK